MHEKRTYFGEFDAEPIIGWLNSKQRPADDPVERLLLLSRKEVALVELIQGKGRREDQVRDYLGDVVRRSKLAVAPILVSATPARWRVEWRAVGRMHPPQALAVIRLLHLADRGLLGRVRKCARPGCGRWFYARFEHQRFHSLKCQQEMFRSDPEWRTKRASYMRGLRQEQKLRERKWLRAARRKEKR